MTGDEPAAGARAMHGIVPPQLRVGRIWIADEGGCEQVEREFGRHRDGNVDLLRKIGDDADFDVEPIELVQRPELGAGLIQRDAVDGPPGLFPDWRRCPPRAPKDPQPFVVEGHDLLDLEQALSIRCIDRERLSVSVNQGVLRIHGFRPNRVPDGARHVHQMEIPHGPFARFVTLPACTDVAHIEAEYEQGYLTVRIPRGRRHE